MCDELVALLDLADLELCRSVIEMRQARTQDGGLSLGRVETQAFDEVTVADALAAVVQPEDAGGEQGVDGGLVFGAVDAGDGESGIAAFDQSARVNGTEAALEVRRRSEFLDGYARIIAGQDAA
jgi:hypothetical protein